MKDAPAECPCGTRISTRTAQLNAGLCDGCLQEALAAEARAIAAEQHSDGLS